MSSKLIPGVQQFRVPDFQKPRVKACLSCREKKRKCNKESPVCSYCRRRNTNCSYSQAGHSKTASLAETKPENTPPKSSCSQSSIVPKAFWPSKQNTDNGPDTFKNITPSMRYGPVYTNIFSSSLFQNGASGSEDLKVLKSYVPDRKKADTLLDRYTSSIHPIVPVFDLREFYPLYETFWDNESVANIEFYIVLFTVFYAASVSEYEEMSIDEHFSLVADELGLQMKYYVGATEIALAMHEFPTQVALVDLQSTFILHYVLRSDCRTDDCGSTGFLVRLAQSIELHRDPWKYHQFTDNRKIQLRRLLWWHIYYLDCTTALSTKISPIIVEGEYDTLYPNEYTKTASGEYRLDRYIAFANRRFSWAELCNRILRLSSRLAAPADQELYSIQKGIDNLAIQCNASVQRISEANTNMAHDSFVLFSTSIIPTLADRCHILVYLAFQMSSPKEISSVADIQVSSIDPDFEESQVRLLQEFLQYGSMPKNKKFLWEIRKYQPIQSILTLLRSLVADVVGFQDHFDSYDSLKALESSLKAEVISNAVENLSYLANHTTPLCRQRWNLVKDLKATTWQQLFTPKTPEIFDDNKAVTGSTCSNSSDESFPLTEESWVEMLSELGKVHRKIDENISIKIWDNDAGHYIL
ncbi:hypothetical protein OGAPHI_001359 [Ogataea philodendri]|uniref:Zn(2)-C6 fungal-type domain-containing protein n=1 Tax=Ogataea philodendri TaxID=1378263 RepID=A0A9P8PBK8_9ASCO|nr:uncharacterized protein OGAPHI_001359 [Ogataea philodendri]KAH3669238.1 hypothetical protein OGAPHI_001359 [Ogataea philodendri]